MTRAKRGFGSVRIVLVGLIVLGGVAACGGGSGSSSAGLTSSTGAGSANPGSGAGGSAATGQVTSNTTPPPAADPPATTTPPVTQSPPPATVAAVNLAWSAPTENSDGTPLTDLKGYKIHYGTQSQNYTGSISVDNPTVTTYLVESLPAGTYYFAVTAYNSVGAESSLSDEVQSSLN
jgi:hypothetical protein